MYLKSIQLTDFRNFDFEKIVLRERVNFFVGENGQGKTNLLEAIYILSRGHSFRPTTSESLVRKTVDSVQHRPAKVIGEFIDRDLDYRVELLIENKRRHMLVNGKKTSALSLFQHFPTILFSPESLTAIKDGPEQRRVLVDDLVIMVNPANQKLLQEFKKCLRVRNQVLRDLSVGGAANAYEKDLTLESLNKIYFLLATHVTAARINALQLMKDLFREAMDFISEENTGEISVDYLMSDRQALDFSEQEIFDALQGRYSELSRQEIASGASLVGPHKHDIRFLFSGKDSRFYCSQGQQRALILSLKIAQIVYYNKVHQTYPVLLLDDVLSELDAKKRVNLLKFLESISAQVLITATDLTWPEQLEMNRNAIFSVTSGQIIPA